MLLVKLTLKWMLTILTVLKYNSPRLQDIQLSLRQQTTLVACLLSPRIDECAKKPSGMMWF